MEDFDFNQYYQNHEVDLSWLTNPANMDFAGAALMVVGENQSDESVHKTVFGKAIAKDNPSDIYFSTSSWLEPN